MTTVKTKTVKIGEIYYRDSDDTVIRFVMNPYSAGSYSIEERIDEYDEDGNLTNEDDWNTCTMCDADVKNILGCQFYNIEGSLDCKLCLGNAQILLNGSYVCDISTCADDIDDWYDTGLEYVEDCLNDKINDKFLTDIETDLIVLVGKIDELIEFRKEQSR